MKRKIFLFFLALMSLTVSAQTKTIQRQPKPAQQTPTKPTPKPSKPTPKQSTTTKTAPASPKRKATPGSGKQGGSSSLSPDKKRILDNLVNNMVYVAGGTFTMGATSEQGGDAWDWEKPTHQVTLSPFSICRYEVTQEEWEAVMGSNPSNFKGAKRPVEMVSWNDCQEFIRKLNDLTGKNFRLPTEAEWEFAARGGNSSRGYKYAGGNDIGTVAWYDGNSDNATHNVGTKQPNELGLYDMSGNVYEWCSDRYGDYSSSSQTNPKGAASSVLRVDRGGSWYDDARRCRVSDRNYFTPVSRYSSLGLRLAF